MLGLPVGQQWPPGSPPAGSERSGGWAGAWGGDGPAETEPVGQHCTHTTGKETDTNSHTHSVILDK